MEPVPVRIPLSLLPTLLTTLPGRKTEEGWNVYKEDELGITAHGGGKLSPFPPSPFFTRSAQIPPCVHLTANAVCLLLHLHFSS